MTHTYLSLAVFGYLGLTLVLGFLGARKVKTSQDFAMAGRQLPLILESAVIFATWFGAETVLGSSAEFTKEGFLGVIRDPFGASLCLVLVGLFFARPLYRMNIYTLCDFFERRFGKTVGKFSAILMVVSYFGWIASQFVAMAFLLQLLLAWPFTNCLWIAVILVSLYTMTGGMWAISYTDLVQSIVIIAGLAIVAYSRLSIPGHFREMVANAPPDFFRVLPKANVHDILLYVAAWITVGLGSIPQQDVFQRVVSAKSEKVSIFASYIAAGLYLTVGLLPLFIAWSFSAGGTFTPENAQTTIPSAILSHTPIGIQILFFGALLSAILSTASGAILAPATILGENILKPLFRGSLSDRRLLFYFRFSVIVIAISSASLALMDQRIYTLAAESSAISLVSLFIPLVAGLYWRKKSNEAAFAAMGLGLLAWFIAKPFDAYVPAVIVGFVTSFLGFLVAALLPFKQNKVESHSVSFISQNS